VPVPGTATQLAKKTPVLPAFSQASLLCPGRAQSGVEGEHPISWARLHANLHGKKRMKSSVKNRVRGLAKEAKGKAKELAGHATRSRRLATEGRAEAARGRARRKVGEIQEDLEDAVEET